MGEGLLPHRVSDGVHPRARVRQLDQVARCVNS